MTHKTKSGSDAYLIVLREIVIAQDIAQTIAEVDPAARIIVTSTPAEALDSLAGVDRLAVAFVSVLPEQFDALPLRQAIAERGGRAVLLGHEAETAGPSDHWDVLPQPFATQTVIAILQQAHGWLHAKRRKAGNAAANSDARPDGITRLIKRPVEQRCFRMAGILCRSGI